MARTDDAVRRASSYWLTVARGLLCGAEPLTLERRQRCRLIEAEMRTREMPVPP